VLSIGLAYFLVGDYGAVGAALSLLISHGLSIAIQFFMVIHYVNVKD